MCAMSLVPDLQAATPQVAASRESAGLALAADAELVARACYDMAVRFHRGGKLIVFGNGGSGTDANHVAVEFVHPVIVGKRALPAMALTNDPATLTGVASREGFAEMFAHQVRCFADPSDIALGISPDGHCANVLRALEVAHELGLLTVALVGGAGGPIASAGTVDHLLPAHAADPCVVKEIHVTTYHILWELVHVFFEQPGVLGPEVIA
jgi:D-sedoheptulose 7-phosphate isomerase